MPKNFIQERYLQNKTCKNLIAQEFSDVMA